MAPNPKLHQLGLALILCFLSTSTSSSSSAIISEDAPTVFDILPKYGLPSGLLPDSVKSHSLSPDGSFMVELEKPCYIQFEYTVYYETRITGKLKYGSITELNGIQVKRLFLWFDVNEIRVDLPPSDSIYFQVGFINKKLDVAQFKTVHTCRDQAALLSCRQTASRLPTSVDEIQVLVTE